VREILVGVGLGNKELKCPPWVLPQSEKARTHKKEGAIVQQFHCIFELTEKNKILFAKIPTGNVGTTKGNSRFKITNLTYSTIITVVYSFESMNLEFNASFSLTGNCTSNSKLTILWRFSGKFLN
jgi:hypothetical protein